MNSTIARLNLRGSAYDGFGESPMMPYLMMARDEAIGLDAKQMSKTWCSGVEAGVNFDLPTEAQWEFCARVGGSESAYPPDGNLG